MNYKNPGVGESASQYSSPSTSSVDEGKRSETEAPLSTWNTDDYREDGALAAGGPAWGVTDESTGDTDMYGPGLGTRKLP